MKLFTRVDIGKVRASNQDAANAFMLNSDEAFGIVCDGMGGAKGGDIASNTALNMISEYVKNSYSPSMDNDKVAQLLKNALASANFELFTSSRSDQALEGMGTTVVAALARKDHAVIVHVGDSRAYLVNETITQLTNDHSIVQSLIESGKLTLTEAKNFPDKNVITRALGVEENVISDYSVVPLKEDDVLLLCTDGLSNFVEPEQVLNVINNESIDNVADSLIDLANNGGGGDNISVVIITQKRG